MMEPEDNRLRGVMGMQHFRMPLTGARRSLLAVATELGHLTKVEFPSPGFVKWG
jgi:hypothetical protein